MSADANALLEHLAKVVFVALIERGINVAVACRVDAREEKPLPLVELGHYLADPDAYVAAAVGLTVDGLRERRRYCAGDAADPTRCAHMIGVGNRCRNALSRARQQAGVDRCEIHCDKIECRAPGCTHGAPLGSNLCRWHQPVRINGALYQRLR